MKKIAVFGSAFNPPSLGHKSVIESLSHFDLVLLVPSIAHAWGKDMLDFGIRTQLIEAFIKDMNASNVELSLIEKELHEPGESVKTYDVLKSIQVCHPDADITFVIGPDNFFKFSSFYKAEEISKQWSVMACPEKLQVRSTDIRNSLNQGQKIEQLTTPSVMKILLDHNLYVTLPRKN